MVFFTPSVARELEDGIKGAGTAYWMRVKKKSSKKSTLPALQNKMK
jgi:hypothetical protein